MSSDRIDASFSTTGSAEGEELSRRRNVPVFGAASNQQHPSLDHPVSEDYKMTHDLGPDGNKYLLLLSDLSFNLFRVTTQRLLTHPYLVFRNQCQLSTRVGTSYRLMPWSIFKPLHSIYKNQGVAALWKGVHNDFIIASLRKALEVILSENFRLPLTLSEPAKGNVFSNYGKHMLLKTISVVAATPLICAGYMLRVQSQVVVGDTNYFSIFSESYHRIVSSIYPHSSETSHMLPLHKLVIPITALSLGSYIIHSMSMGAVHRQYQQNTLHIQDVEHDEVPWIKTIYDRYYPQLVGAFSGHFIADVFFYPLSTITGRLVLQGTRTIIDDVETGNAVLPFNSNYTGVVNCMQSIISEEGVTGLYKGFGALVMQYTVQALFLRATHLLYERIMETHYPRVPLQNLYTSATPSSTYSSVNSLNNKS
ncbi:hypothetical protein EB796_022125 [Bugula neritina]|uniref:SLC25A46 n=1 Tax=Bugula neritina TaxID=10212 RepID=A0A7J7J050_BUGNE|nr:hypothetical protein EB796_022125 [Bugula neritina]